MTHKKRKHAKPSPRPAKPQNADALSARFPVTPDQEGEMLHFVVTPFGEGDTPLWLGPTGRFEIKLFVGRSTPDENVKNVTGSAPHCLLHLGFSAGIAIGHELDTASAPEFHLTPDDKGYLDVISVVLDRNQHYFTPRPDDVFTGTHNLRHQLEAEDEAYRRISGWLSWYSFRFRVPINIHGIRSKDLCSGHQHITVRANFTPVQIKPEDLLTGRLAQDFDEAFSLYREALGSENTFYRFQTLFKIWELLMGVDGRIGLRPKLSKELIEAGCSPNRGPEAFTSGKYQGQRFTDVVDKELRKAYRDAVAHVSLKTGVAIRPGDLWDIRRTEEATLYLHQAVRTILLNECAAFQRLKSAKGWS